MAELQHIARRPRVSVVMSVYNGAYHLRESVESILNQTFGDFEFIIVDDGSTDSTSAILATYAAQDTRIVLLRNEENIGLTRSLNKGLERAQGEYIARQDADDISLPERFARQVAYLDAHSGVGLLGTASQNINEHGSITGESCPPSTHHRIRWALLFGNNFVHTSVMFRQNLVQQVGCYAVHIKYAQDYEYWYRMSKTTQLANMAHILVARRIGQNRITARHFQSQEETVCSVMQAAIEDLLQEPVAAEHIAQLRALLQGKALSSARAIRAVAQRIRTLYRTFQRTQAVPPHDRHAIAVDAASKLYILAGQNIRHAPLAALWVSMQAQQLDRRVPGRSTLRQVFVNAIRS